MYWPKEPYDPNRKKHEIKYAFKIGDRVRTTLFVDLFNVNMILGGLEKFLK